MVERRASNRKATDPWFNSCIGNALSCLWKDILGLIFTKPSSLPVVVAQSDERLATKPEKVHLRWCGYTGAECKKTSEI